MHLRKLAWTIPLMLAATAVQADTSGSFLEGAKLAALARPEAQAPANSPSHRHPAGVRTVSAAQPQVTQTSPSTSSAAVIDTESESNGASFEIRNFLTLVVALALVGWIQRRRRDA